MIDPILSLAFSIQANKGVYALLLGSGVSRAAKIPTGWEITLDLVRRLADVAGETCDPSPEQWYLGKFGKAPDYAELLDGIVKTPAERQQLLRYYWEASAQERDEGAKQPTAAHRAIASLVAQNFVKVIITTNFDRLMETALADVGITPTILSSPDQVQGSLPLIHTRCCLFKIHGDYLDTRIRNTPEELAAYPAEFDALLDRIFDEFGLVVCGWSADWDEALRKALLRAPSRRFTTYWGVCSEPSQSAQQLINHRSAQLVTIKDADSFFTSVQQHVQSLEEFSRPHPLSTEAAVASLKRYLTEPRFRIQLADLINDEIDHVLEATSGPKFYLQGGAAPDNASASARVHAYEDACSTLLTMAPIGAFWATEDHYYLWQNSLQRLSSLDRVAGFSFFLELRRYPATLLLYTLGLGAMEASRLHFIGELLTTLIPRQSANEIQAVKLLPPLCLFEESGMNGSFLKGMESHYFPLSDWLHNTLRKHIKRLVPNDTRYTFIFDKLEFLIALSYAYNDELSKTSYWIPLGAFGYRESNRDRIYREIDESITSEGEDSPFVKSKIFGASVEECTYALSAFTQYTKEVCKKYR